MTKTIQILVKGTVTVPSVPTISYVSSNLPMGSKGVAYSGQINFTGGLTADWSSGVATGSLPPGLLPFSTGGTCSAGSKCIGISGTPTTNGSYTFSVEINQGGVSFPSPSLNILIADQFSPLSITSDFNLPRTKAGESWSTTVLATGGSESYKWSVSSGTIPPGTEIIQAACRGEGACKTPFTLSGTPTTPGYYVFTVTVQSGSQVAVKMFNITVYEDTPPKDTSAVVTAGYLDLASCDTFGGWAKDGDNPNSAVEVQLWSKVENLYWKKIGDYSANINRADVGQHAFSFFTPSSLRDGKNHYVYVFARNVAGDYTRLSPYGVKLTCGSVSSMGSNNLDQIANSLEAIKNLFNSLFR
jgi:hypothetical protein